MRLGLQAGFSGNPVPGLPEVAERYSLIRIDVQNQNHDVIQLRALEILQRGSIPLCIITDAGDLQALPAGAWAELRNEPDLAPSMTPEAYSLLAAAAAVEAERLGLILYVGAVSNLNKRGLTFLSKIRWEVLPPSVRVSVHRYPGKNFSTPHPGFSSRQAEVFALRRIIGRRRWGVSEVGYHTGRRPFLFFFSKKWTDTQVAHYMRQERDFWRFAGADFCIAYQLGDGPTSHPLDRYGFRRLSADGALGEWKPVDEAFRNG